MERRIAIVGHTTGYGGIERMILNWYKNIDRTKVQFDFIVPHDYDKIAFEDEIVSMGGRVFRILYSESESFIKSRQCWKDFFDMHPEVVGVHVHASFPYAFPLKMAKKAGITLRLLHSHCAGKTDTSNKIIQAVREIKVDKEINKSPTHYLACSDKSAAFMFPNKEYIWIKNGVNIEKFRFNEETRNAIRAQYNIDDSNILIGMIGHLTDVKNPLYAIEMLREILKYNKKVTLVFIGEGILHDEIVNKIQKYNMESNVIFLGKIEDTSVWYQAFDILIMPSRSEGFPVTLVEAQTSGVPCLVADVITRQVDITGLIRYKSTDVCAEEWAREIDEMISNKIFSRSDAWRMVKEAGFDMIDGAKALEKIYLSDL